MTTVAKGTFEVHLQPQSPEAGAGDASIGRMAFDKRFEGELEATSKGQMLAVQTDTQGSAGYVAMERVAGTLAGRSGSFALQHSGIMNRGEPKLSVSVVPDSGTDELAGLAGEMDIDISNGDHTYVFRYQFGAG